MIPETLKFTVDTSDAACPYSVKLIVNGDVQWSTEHLTKQQLVEFTFDDEVEQEFTFEIHVDGKTEEFTSIDEQGKIVKDSLVSIKNFMLGDIEIDQVILDQTEYIHSFNDTEIPATVHKFYGDVGCNGFIKFRLTAPSYLWLLEHM